MSGEAGLDKPHILQVGAYPAWDQEPLERDYTLHRLYEAADRAACLAEVGPRVRAIATRGDLGADRAMIAACPGLEIITVYGVGFDAVDIEACRARGIRVTNTPDVLTGDVADLGVAMALALARGVVGGDAWVRQGRWAEGPYPLQRRVWGKRAGILGLGRIGLEVARRLKGFGMEIAYSSRAPKPVAEAEGLAYLPDPVALADWAELLFVTLAATPETRRIVGPEVIAALGPEGLLINISRGSTVDEAALLAALEAGRLGGAALDVFEGEPHIDPRFCKLDNVLLQPHHASATVETRKAMGQLVRDNLAAHFAGRPLPTPVL
jgi:lactate dehydrogenase-like 2-hydroxyacid dehydrogenase